MALFKIFKGSSSEKLLRQGTTGYRALTDGYAYYDTSSKLFYIDAEYPEKNKNGNIKNNGVFILGREAINAQKSAVSGEALNGIYYGTCDTVKNENGQNIMEVNLINSPLGFILRPGLTISVKINTTINLSKSDDIFFKFLDANKPSTNNENEIKFYNETDQLIDNSHMKIKFSLSNSLEQNFFIKSNTIILFVYNGTSWETYSQENSYFPFEIRGEPIPEQSNLNNYITPGTYYTPTNSSASTIINQPQISESGFKMFVVGGYGPNQKFQLLNGLSDSWTIRRSSTTKVDGVTTTVWGNWYRFAMMPINRDTNTGPIKSIGSATKPIYINGNGIITETSDTLDCNISGQAEKVNWSGIQNKPASTSATTANISIAKHSTTSLKGVSGTVTASCISGYTKGTPSTWSFTNITVPVKADSETIVPVANANATECSKITQWAAGGGEASLTLEIDQNDPQQLNINFSHTHTSPNLTYDEKSVTGVSGTVNVLGVKNNETKTASHATGSNGTVTTITYSNKTVATANDSATTVVTGSTHTITDNGHRHSI